MSANGCIKCGNVHEYAGYIYGFCDACAKSILEASAKRLQRKANVAAPDKRLEQDLAKAQASIAALANAEANQRVRLESPEALASFRSAVESESKRMSHALTDRRLLWSIFRRSDKSSPYYETAQPIAEPVSVVTPEAELVAAA